MRILLVNTYENKGGASIAVQRLQEALQAAGVDARLLVQHKYSVNDTVIGPSNIWEKISFPFRPYLDFLPAWLHTFKRKPFFPAFLPGNAVQRINKEKPDIVHLHWISGGFISVKELARIPYPIVWTMHDMWTFTGGCHYSGECMAYERECGSCPQLYSSKKKDMSFYGLVRKSKAYPEMDARFTAPSSWLTSTALKSLLLRNSKCITIPNLINTSVFYPRDTSGLKSQLNLDADKKIILFGAVDATSNPLKGYDILMKALRNLRIKNAQLLVFGSSRKGTDCLYEYPIRYLGKISDENKLAEIYSVADVMVVPSIQETFGQTITESMACGTSVVAFKATGPADIIRHKKTGYLASPFEAADLANGIDYVLKEGNRSSTLSEQARKDIIERFSYETVLPAWIKLYEEVLQNRGKK